MIGEPTFFEIGVADTARARSFYGGLFGWRIEPGPSAEATRSRPRRFPAGCTGATRERPRSFSSVWRTSGQRWRGYAISGPRRRITGGILRTLRALPRRPGLPLRDPPAARGGKQSD